MLIRVPNMMLQTKHPIPPNLAVDPHNPLNPCFYEINGIAILVTYPTNVIDQCDLRLEYYTRENGEEFYVRRNHCPCGPSCWGVRWDSSLPSWKEVTTTNFYNPAQKGYEYWEEFCHNGRVYGSHYKNYLQRRAGYTWTGRVADTCVSNTSV